MELIEGDQARELFQAEAHIWKHMCNFIVSMSLRCAVQLGIPDILYNHGKPITLSKLVAELAVPETKTSCLFRLMRLLVHSGFFSLQKVSEDEQEEGYVLTPSSRILLKDNATSLSLLVLGALDPALVTSSYFMGVWFQGSEVTPFETAHKMSFWNYAGQHPEFNKLFNEAMASNSRLLACVIGTECKPIFEGLRSLVDVGGGTGAYARAIAEAFPDLKCTVLDLPQVVASLVESKNLDYVGGDMFETIPPAEAILLKLILHNWSDDNCVKILKRCREAIPTEGKGGKVIIIDIVLGDKNGEHDSTEAQLFFDILMMNLFAGKERTEKEWEKLFLEAGFTSYKIIPILGFRSIIEVYP